MDPSRINCEIFKDTWERRYEILVDKIHRGYPFHGNAREKNYGNATREENVRTDKGK